MSEDDFSIDNLDKFQKLLLKTVEQRFPDVIERILVSLGEVLLGSAKKAIKEDKRPHARFEKKTRSVSRGKNLGKVRNYLAYTNSVNTNAVDSGMLWNSLSRGTRGNVWRYNGKSKSFSLTVGSSVKYAGLINDGYKMNTPHWVPGTIDGRGIFRYQRGASTGLFVRPYEYKGVKFFNIGFKELEKIAPKIIQKELKRFEEEFNSAS